MQLYTNKTILITGASSGIGEAMARQLAQYGAKLILVARSQDKLAALAQDIKNTGGDARVFVGDLSVPGAAESLYAQVRDADLHVDILINNAGYGRRGEFTEFGRDDYASMIQLNIITLTELCHLFVSDMVDRGSGGIINVASTAAFVPIPYGAVYGSTKSYVLTFSEALRYEYQDQGIAVMALCPGATESKFMSVATEQSEVARQNTKKELGMMNFQTSEQVAAECLKAYANNKQYIISGRSNRVMFGITRHLPRGIILSFVGNMFRKIVGK